MAHITSILICVSNLNAYAKKCNDEQYEDFKIKQNVGMPWAITILYLHCHCSKHDIPKCSTNKVEWPIPFTPKQNQILFESTNRGINDSFSKTLPLEEMYNNYTTMYYRSLKLHIKPTSDSITTVYFYFSLLNEMLGNCRFSKFSQHTQQGL